MAKRPSVEDRLAEIRGLRNQEPSPELAGALKTAIADRSNLIVAMAAEIAGDRGLTELTGPLEAAFTRFLVDPVRTDKLCRAKVAIVKALDGMEHDAEEVFRKAATHVQEEPVWGGTEDTAAPLRAAAILALTRVNALDLMTILVEALVDPEKEVRGAAAQALGAVGSQAAALLLRLKIRIGDREAEVLSDCLAGLLAADLPAGLELACERLRSNDVPTCEAAAMALARSRRPEAFDALRECWERPILPLPLKEAVLLAMGMLRLPAPTDFLIQVVAEEPPQIASLALAALKIQAHDSRLRDRLAAIMAKRESPELRARLARDFPG